MGKFHDEASNILTLRDSLITFLSGEAKGRSISCSSMQFKFGNWQHSRVLELQYALGWSCLLQGFGLVLRSHVAHTPTVFRNLF
jgi:hypothetical protein